MICTSNANEKLFQANTMLAMGRNIGLKEAIKSTLWDTFKYIVVFDDDVILLDLVQSSQPEPQSNQQQCVQQRNWRCLF
jgi:hypothetical protein